MARSSDARAVGTRIIRVTDCSFQATSPVKRRRRAARFVVAALLGLVLTPATSRGAAIAIDDVSPNPTGDPFMTITWQDFEGGMTVNGVFFAFPGSGIQQSVTVDERTGPLSFSGTWIANGGSNGSGAVNFLESDGSVSDTFQGSWTVDQSGQASLSGLFNSDENPLTAIPGGINVADETDPVLLSSILNMPPNLTFYATSDVDPIPEPATLTLVGLGGALAAWRLRRSRRSLVTS